MRRLESDRRDGKYEFTPEDCATLWEKKAPNRHFSEIRAKGIAYDMQRNKYRANGEAIVLGERTGRLLDGQHRVRAGMIAGVPFISYAVWGPESTEVLESFDQGATRNTGHVLSYRHDNYKERAAIAALVLRYESMPENFLTKGEMSRGRRSGLVSRSDIVALGKTADIGAAATIAKQTYGKNRLLPKSAIGFLHYVAAKKHGREVVETFLLEYAEQSGAPDSASRLLNRRLASSASRMSDGERLGLLIRAWNAAINKERLSLLKAPDSSTKVA